MSASAPAVAVARTGVANMASVCAAVRRAGLNPVCTDDPEEFADAALAVLPGVGSFAPGMEALRSTGLDRAVIARAEDSRPLLAICLGMQMLCDRSDEAPGVAGLGIVPTAVVAMGRERSLRMPQLGWNRVCADNAVHLRDGEAYFANSFAAASPPSGWGIAWYDHGGRFIAAVERGTLLACQFHPELSGDWGQRLIERWVIASLKSKARSC